MGIKDKEEAHRELKDLSPLQASNWDDGVAIDKRMIKNKKKVIVYDSSMKINNFSLSTVMTFVNTSLIS